MNMAWNQDNAGFVASSSTESPRKLSGKCFYVLFCILSTVIISLSSVADATTTTTFGSNSFEIPIYSQPSIVKPKPNPWHNDTISLRKFMDSQYYGVIRIGNPAKEFKMVFDTTWADSWVPSEHCGLLELACMVHNRYYSSRSSTYVEDGRPFSTDNPTDDLRGFLSQDSINLSHMTVKNQTFIEMTHIPWIPYGIMAADGLIGLGFPSLSLTKVPTFFSNMYKQGLIKKPLFTFYLNRDPTTDRAGRLIIGETERKHIGNNTLTVVPVIEQAYWKIKVDKIIVNDTKTREHSHSFCQHSCEAIFDTSVNTITGPSNEVDRINDLLGARSFLPKIFKLPRYMVNCRKFSSLSPVIFTIAGKNFTINSKYYVQHLTYESIEVCLSPFIPSNQTFWQLGGAFLTEFYTEYNFNTGQIMIAKTRY